MFGKIWNSKVSGKDYWNESSFSKLDKTYPKERRKLSSFSKYSFCFDLRYQQNDRSKLIDFRAVSIFDYFWTYVLRVVATFFKWTRTESLTVF